MKEIGSNFTVNSKWFFSSRPSNLKCDFLLQKKKCFRRTWFQISWPQSQDRLEAHPKQARQTPSDTRPSPAKLLRKWAEILWCRWTLRRPLLASAGERILASFPGSVLCNEIQHVFFARSWSVEIIKNQQITEQKEKLLIHLLDLIGIFEMREDWSFEKLSWSWFDFIIFTQISKVNREEISSF